MKPILFSRLLSFLTLGTVQAALHQGSIFAFGGGDPHVSTWNGERFEFHQPSGDFVLVESPDFSNGLGLDIHIRTKKNDWMSYIEAAVLRVGDETIQVVGGKEHSRYWINGEEGYSVLEPREEMRIWLKQGQEVTIRQVNAKQFQIRVDLGHDEGVVFETYQEFIRVDVQGNDEAESFSNSQGLLGSLQRTDKLNSNGDRLASEWAISSSEEATLFRT